MYPQSSTESLSWSLYRVLGLPIVYLFDILISNT